MELNKSLFDLIFVGLWTDIVDNGVSVLKIVHDFIRLNWIQENSVMVLTLLLISSNLGGNGLDGHWLGESLLGLVSVESGGGSDLDSSLLDWSFDLNCFSLFLDNVLWFCHWFISFIF